MKTFLNHREMFHLLSYSNILNMLLYCSTKWILLFSFIHCHKESLTATSGELNHGACISVSYLIPISGEVTHDASISVFTES